MNFDHILVCQLAVKVAQHIDIILTNRLEGEGSIVFSQDIAITDHGNNRIQEFTMDGKCISCVSTKASNNGPLYTSVHGDNYRINKTTGQVLSLS